jgi:N-glycosylase/DNA lyase
MGGQTFRWKRGEGGVWMGVDGPFAYRLRIALVDDDWRIEGEGTGAEADFASFLRLDVSSVEAARRVLKRRPNLAADPEAAEGLRLIRPSCPIEAAISFLCTSNNHVPRIAMMVERLAERGPEMPGPGGCVRRFPSLDQVAAIPEGALRAQGFGYRGATIPRAAASALEKGGEAWLAELKEAALDRIRSELTSLPGVGPKLAECIALFALDRMDAVPVDTHVWRAGVRVFFPEWEGRRPSAALGLRISEAFRSEFGPDAAFAQQIAFRSEMIAGRRRMSL